MSNMTNPGSIAEETMPHGKARRIILLLSASLAIITVGSSLTSSVLTKRVSEFGSGEQMLGYMSTSLALGQFLLAPLIGSLADRYGRRPLILVGLAGTTIMNSIYVFGFAQSPAALIVFQFLQGAISVGLLPISMSVVADVMPERHRAQWIGILTGCYSFGALAGAVLGGVMYDVWGYTLPFLIAAAPAMAGLLLVLFLIPETRPASPLVRSEAAISRSWSDRLTDIWASFPRPLVIFFALLSIDFIVGFGNSYSQPPMTVYAYNSLGLTATQFGVLFSANILAVLVGQLTLGSLSDRFGARATVTLGFLLGSSMYFGLIFLHSFISILIAFLIAGLGLALTLPAIGSYYLDISAPEHRARIVGIDASVAALAGILGSLFAAISAGWITHSVAFALAGGMMVVAGLIALIWLKMPTRPRVEPNLQDLVSVPMIDQEVPDEY